MEIKNTQVFGLERSLIAAGNPMVVGDINTDKAFSDKDIERAKKLCKQATGSGHVNFLSGIQVMFDIKYTQYWSMEFQRYHFAQIVSSTSKMHRLVASAFQEDFPNNFNQYVDKESIDKVSFYINEYVNADEKDKYFFFMKALSNLPMGYCLWMTVTTNYLQLKTIYEQRKHHKLKEDWGYFCKWIEGLPMADILIMKD